MNTIINIYYFEYTISKKDGEFAVYDMYPYFTEEDWSIIKKAKNKKS